MYWSLLYYPEVGIEALDRLRRKYDPLVDFIPPHVPVVFPVPAPEDEASLFAHVEQVLRGRKRFPLRLRGLEKSPDHWLFLLVEEGFEELVELFEAMYTGPLAPFRRHDLEYVPHVGLGLFVKPQVRYEMSAQSRAADLDEPTYREALSEAQAARIDIRCELSMLHLVEIGDEILDWAHGTRPDVPTGAKARTGKRFELGERG
jgi:2'-5' RNA ligase